MHAKTPNLLMPLQLGDALNAGAFGGTATVRRILTAPYLYSAAKIFNDDVLPLRRQPSTFDKLSILAAASEGLKRGTVGGGVVEPGRPHVAWPEAMLFDANSFDVKHFIGFTMPLFSDGMALSKLTSPKQRKQAFPGLGADGLLIAARNLAGAVACVHGPDGRSGIVIGDLTPRNVLVLPDLRCQLIDADSYQFQTAAKLLGSSDTTPGFRSPRIAEAARAGGALPPFTLADDAYCLAIVLFHVLVDGAHPWLGGEKFEVSGVKPDEEDNMLAGRFPYAAPATYHPPKIRVQTYQKLPLPIRAAFELAFVKGQPMSPHEWWDLLGRALTSASGAPRAA